MMDSGMRGSPSLTCLLLLALAAGGCASRADLLKVEREQRELRAQLADAQVVTDRLRRDVDALREQNRGAAPSGAQVRDMDRRLRALEDRVAAAPALPVGGQPPGGVEVPPPGGPPAAVPGTPAAALAMAAEESSLASAPDPYRTAVELYRQGEWARSIEKFRDFLRTNAKSDLAANAQYWIGEAYFSQRDYNRAIIELNEVLLKHPKSPRVPGALLALATAFADSGDRIDAKLILQKLLSDHPASQEAALGRSKLETLGN
jgi:tol-pal system protein YbgF